MTKIEKDDVVLFVNEKEKCAAARQLEDIFCKLPSEEVPYDGYSGYEIQRRFPEVWKFFLILKG